MTRHGAGLLYCVVAATIAMAGAAATTPAGAQSAGATAAPTPRQASEGPDARRIRARRESSNDAIARHDTAGIGAIIADHGVILTSGSVLQVGRAAQLISWSEMFAERPDVVYRRTPALVRVFLPWGMASETGTWSGSWTAPDGKVSIAGHYFAKWRRIGGAWFVESETYVPERCTGSAFCAQVP